VLVGVERHVGLRHRQREDRLQEREPASPGAEIAKGREATEQLGVEEGIDDGHFSPPSEPSVEGVTALQPFS
jgi:hypothetical protein